MTGREVIITFNPRLIQRPSIEIDDFDIVLFQIYGGTDIPAIISIYRSFAKLLQK